MQIFTRTGTPSTTNVFFCTFALNVRFVLGALRSQRPECLCLILRPKAVPLPQTSHLANCLSPLSGLVRPDRIRSEYGIIALTCGQ